MMEPSPAFVLRNPSATGPVVISVPHAGRDYRREHSTRLRPPIERLAALEDRLVDMLVSGIADAPTLIASTPRVWIDLNRHEAEIDPGLVENMVASRLMLTAKVRNGLGLIPRRLAGIGELWRTRLTKLDVETRLATIHRPYHATLARLLATARSREGTAVLLDLHSMPPLRATQSSAAPNIVIGNRFGQSAAPWATAALIGTCKRFGLSWGANTPYAGGYIIERHAAPTTGVHALQLEIDRSLYLDAALHGPDSCGVAAMQRFVVAVVDDLSIAAINSALPIAAE